MANCFSGTKQGRIAQQKHERTVQSLIKEEYKKHYIPNGSIDWPPEEIEAHNECLRKEIEKKIRDDLT